MRIRAGQIEGVAMMKLSFRSWLGLGMLLLLGQLHAQSKENWTIPIDPFRIAGNLYYVGSKDLASYLVVTPQGNILINSGLGGLGAADPRQRRKARLPGFMDTRTRLISHAHMHLRRRQRRK